jgi:hypothetical protein
METTTIEITKSQAKALDNVANGSYKDKLQVLIDCYDDQGQSLDEATVRRIAQEEINDMVAYKALE